MWARAYLGRIGHISGKLRTQQIPEVFIGARNFLPLLMMKYSDLGGAPSLMETRDGEVTLGGNPKVTRHENPGIGQYDSVQIQSDFRVTSGQCQNWIGDE